MGAIFTEIRLKTVKKPILSKQNQTLKIWGNIESITPLERGYRIIMSNIFSPQLEKNSTPYKIRIKLLTNLNNARVGDRVMVKAILSPPEKPYLINSYDFARDAYFKQIGAVGYAISDLKIAKSNEKNSFKNKINRLRNRILENVNNKIGNKSGSIATALMINEYSNIEKEDLKNLRISGLAHVLSVSGMHLSLVAAIFFIVSRFIINCMGNLSSVYNTKKIAALISLIGISLYLLISGMEVAAIRSYIMSATIIIAIIIDRSSDPMRAISLAALIILTFNPENIVFPSFQMSFAAVIALVSAYEIYCRINLTFFRKNLVNKFILYFLNSCFASLIAGLATAPFVIYHFGQSSNYSVIANLIATPITSFWLMPLVVITFFLMPLNLEHFSLKLMEPGIKALLSVSNYIALKTNSVSFFSKLSSLNLMIISVGFIILCVFKSKIRLAGLFLIIIAILIQTTSSKSIIFIDWELKIIAAMNKNNELVFLKGKLPKFKRELLMSYFGTNKYIELDKRNINNDIICKRNICYLHKNKYLVKFNLVNLNVYFFKENKLFKILNDNTGILLTNEYAN